MLYTFARWLALAVILTVSATATAQQVVFPDAAGRVAIPGTNVYQVPVPATPNFTPPADNLDSTREYATRFLQRHQQDPTLTSLIKSYADLRLPATEAVPVLLKFLEPDENEQRSDRRHLSERQMYALRGLHDNYPTECCSARSRILELVRGEDTAVAREAAATLGAMRPVTPESVAVLVDVLNSSEEERPIHRTIVINGSVTPQIFQKEDTWNSIKIAAAKGLQAMGPDAIAAADILRTRMASPHAELGYHAFLAWDAVTSVPGFATASQASIEEQFRIFYREAQAGRIGLDRFADSAAEMYPQLPPGCRAVVLEMVKKLDPASAKIVRIVLSELSSRDALLNRFAGFAAAAMVPAHEQDIVDAISTAMGSGPGASDSSQHNNDDALARGACALAIHYGEHRREFEYEAQKGLRRAIADEQPFSRRIGSYLGVLRTHPPKNAETVQLVESIMLPDSPVYRGFEKYPLGASMLRGYAMMTAAANGPSGSPEAIKCAETALANTKDSIEFGGAADYVGALPAGAAKNRLAPYLARALKHGFPDRPYMIQGAGGHTYGPMPGYTTSARFQAIQAINTMDVNFIRGLEPLLREQLPRQTLLGSEDPCAPLVAELLKKVGQ